LDICIKKGEKLIHENHEMIVECEIFEKIHEKMLDYGFILRYLEGKENIT
jgi:D-alanyl-D-alanine carboxypeptidase